MKNETRYYNSYDDDFVTSKNQSFTIPKNYKWLRTSLPEKLVSGLLYALALVISFPYCKFFLHLKIKNKKLLKQARKSGAFIYANHTQPIGDAFIPAFAAFPKRIYTLVSPANLGITFLGRLLSYLGALPIPSSLGDMKKFSEAIRTRADENNCIIIYPEAHVWEYCTEIRPFSSASFSFPIKYGKPVYSMTATYQRRKHGKKPKMTVYVDGPFESDPMLSRKAQELQLHSCVFEKMKERSSLSSYNYIEYKPKQ